MSTNGNGLFEALAPMSVMQFTLAQCEFCSIGFEDEDLKEFEGFILCDECKTKHREEIERVRISNQIQTAMDELPADELLSLRWVLSIALQQFEDKTGCENIHKWNDRITSALKGKAIDEKKRDRHSGTASRWRSHSEQSRI